MNPSHPDGPYTCTMCGLRHNLARRRVAAHETNEHLLTQCPLCGHDHVRRDGYSTPRKVWLPRSLFEEEVA